VSEEQVTYQVQSLLKPDTKHVTLGHEQMPAPVDWASFERQLIPLLNWVRRAQGKKPVIVPK
jgi:hypothetical protein